MVGVAVEVRELKLRESFELSQASLDASILLIRLTLLDVIDKAQELFTESLFEVALTICELSHDY